MPWVDLGTGSAVRQAEGLVLDPDGTVGAAVDLGTLTGWLRLSGFSISPAQKSPTWASSGDSDGAQLVRTPYYQNREGVFAVRVNTSDGDSAMGAIGALEEKLQEADRLAAGGGNGLPVLWTPAGATTGLTLYLLLAQITDMPITVDDGWFAHKPILTVAFTAKPFLYGSEVTGPSATGTSQIITLDVPSVPGDVAAEARLVVTDNSSKARRYAEWGLEQFYYDPGSPDPVMLDSASLVTSGFAGTAHAHSGAQGGTTIAANLIGSPMAIAGTGSQPHVGTWRVKGRVYAPSTSEYWRLTWQDGDGPFKSNAYAQPVVAADFSEVDLGTITVQPATLGSQKWSGRIEAYTGTAGGELGELDDLLLYPAEQGYERIAATYAYRPGVVTAHDEFTGTTSGSALNGHVAPTGGTWVTSGTTPDFAFQDGPGLGDESVNRGGTADYRYAILGSSSTTDTEVSVSTQRPHSGQQVTSEAIARWTNSSNYARLRLTDTTIFLETVVAGTAAVLAKASVTELTGAWQQLRLVVYASGRAVGVLIDPSGSIRVELNGISSVLATGGTLATGQRGFADKKQAGGAIGCYYDNFYAAVPAAEPLTINSGKSLQITSSGDYRQSSDGVSYGQIVGRGRELFLPAAGNASRTSRIVVRATRNDLTSMADSSVADGDSITAQIFYTPRFLAVPRA